MNGAQDLGGMQSFGPVVSETDEPYFHADWERHALALTIAMGSTGKWNIDMSRAARESLPPAQYLSSSYYQIWFAGLRKLLIDTGLATSSEIDSGVLQQPAAPVPRVLAADQVNPMLFRGSPASRPAPSPARFAVRGKRGRIVAVHGAHVFPDSNSLGRGEDPRWLYTVRFDAIELWGKDTTASAVCADCWEPYLEADGAA